MDRERRAKRREGEQSGLLLTLGETKHHLEGVEKHRAEGTAETVA